MRDVDVRIKRLEQETGGGDMNLLFIYSFLRFSEFPEIKKRVKEGNYEDFEILEGIGSPSNWTFLHLKKGTEDDSR